MKNLMLLIFTFFIVSLISCDKKDTQMDENTTTPEKMFSYDNAGTGIDITIERKKDWAIIIDLPDPCTGSKGLCAKIETVDPNDPYNSKIATHLIDSTKMYYLFPDAYIDDEDELIENGEFIIDSYIPVDYDAAIELGYSASFTVKPGDYQIEDDNSGWQAVLVDIDY